MSTRRLDPVVGIVPAAGHATRLQPLDRSKEMLGVDGKPLMDHLLERMTIVERCELRIVTRRDKKDVMRRAEQWGAYVVLGEPADVSESLLLGLADVSPDAVVLIGFPDTVWQPIDGFVRLCERAWEGVSVVLGLFRTDEPERCDVVLLDGRRVRRVLVKPSPAPDNLIWGCAVAKADVLRKGLDGAGEPGAFFDRLASRGMVEGVYLSDSYVDLGTREALQSFPGVPGTRRE